MSNPISLHISGPQGRRDGLGEWLARLAAAGCAPAVIYSVNVDISPDIQQSQSYD